MFWSKKKSVPYIALAERESSSSEEREELLGQEKNNLNDFVNENSETKKSKFSVVLVAIAIVLSVTNLTFFVGRASSKASTSSDLDLEFASAYIGLDKLRGFDAATFNYTIENMPLVVGSVDRDHPNALRPDETPHWWTFQGTVVPDRRHILVTETISTIVQFRALDFGLETCQLTITLPTYASLVNSTVESENNKPRTYSFSAPSVPVHVWALESATPGGRELELDLSQLTFANRPSRKTYLGVIDAREGGKATADTFACKSASLHTLELSCEISECLLDFWADAIEPRMALFIKQSSS